MGKVTGFMEYTRELPQRREPAQRIKDWFEIYQPFPEDHLRTQAARCMDCGVPFCHTGCPLTNIIPDWNDLVYKGRWKEAVRQLHATNNFPEFTGRICPAPCEAACVLGINEPAVTIKQIEKTIIDRAFEQGYIVPEPAAVRSGKRVAVIGSGPAGLAAAQQLARAGHEVTVFEKNDRIGGLLRYGIPNFKMEKHLIDRRLEQMRAEGVKFETNAHVGGNVPVEDLRHAFDAILLAGGAEQPREFERSRARTEGHPFRHGVSAAAESRVRGRYGTRPDSSHGQARHYYRRRRYGRGLPGHEPPAGRAFGHAVRTAAQAAGLRGRRMTPWPLWPMQLRIESSHEEGGTRDWSVNTVKFTGDENGNVKRVACGARDRRRWKRCRGPNSLWRPTWCCWPWASRVR